MRLFFADGCPFAQRTRALLTGLQVPFDTEVVDLSNKSPEFLAISPAGTVPALEDDGLVLFESSVINEYLAEKHRWADGFSSEVRHRARERLAMKRFDELLLPLFFRSLKTPQALDEKPSWKREVQQVGEATSGRPARSLLGYHLGTHWLRMVWLAPNSPMVAAFRQATGSFLDEVTKLPEVSSTTPDQHRAVEELRIKFGLPAPV